MSDGFGIRPWLDVIIKNASAAMTDDRRKRDLRDAFKAGVAANASYDDISNLPDVVEQHFRDWFMFWRIEHPE